MSQAKPPCNETIQIAQSDGDNNYLSNMPNAIISEVLSMPVERIAVFVTLVAVITMIVKVLSAAEIVAISVGAVILSRNKDNVDIDKQNISNESVEGFCVKDEIDNLPFNTVFQKTLNSKLENKPEKGDIAASGNIKRNQMTKAIRIVELDESNNYALNLSELEKLLLDKRCVGKKVSIISIAGAYRKGKSFILNFFLRYLNAHKNSQTYLKTKAIECVNNIKKMIPPTVNDEDYRESILSRISSYLEKPPKDWINTVEKVEGFSWRGGYERDTIGIMIWGEPFFLRDNNGEDIVVILMDTQGAFDNNSTVKDNATIFALSTMIASLQIFNISGNIQEDDLQHLEYFSEYGRLALTKSDGKPFQALTFLVRDWSCKHQYEYGFNGGQSLLGKKLDIHQNHHSSLNSLRKNLKNYFEKMKCFLMPHPGLIVSHDPEFTGKLDEMEKDFKIHLESFVEHTFDKNNLIPKKINGSDLTCRDLFEYFKKYITIFQGEELPEPKSIFQATAEANNSAAASKAKALYDNEVEIICGADKPFMKNDEFEKRHEEIKCKKLDIHQNHHSSLNSLRKNLKNYFEKMKCFLMPHPGLIVSHDPEFTGKLDEMEKDFKIHLESFVEHTFDKNNLIPKKINGSDLTCRDLFEYFKKYITIFQGEELPEPKSIFQATAEANNSAAASKAKALYDNEVEIICGADKPFMKNDEFEKRHEEIKCKALESFKNAKKMGGLEYSVKILEGLENYFKNKMKYYVHINASKKIPDSEKASSTVAGICETLKGVWVAVKEIPTIFEETWVIVKGIPTTVKETWATLKRIPTIFEETWVIVKGIPTTVKETWATLKRIPTTVKRIVETVARTQATVVGTVETVAGTIETVAAVAKRVGMGAIIVGGGGLVIALIGVSVIKVISFF
uniref:GB1/RHD3-type G domain-containing protein n=1 Tax=Rhabditophanes sp. KR3021 TaxID=114890 RepID=A0AC35UAX4_9BILA